MTPHLPPQHPLRLDLAHELHARPFPELTAPCRAVHLALKAPRNAVERDPEADRDHLRALIDRFGAAHPAPGADHWSGRLGRVRLKWERHAEFVTYTIFAEGVAETPFENSASALFPADWLAESPGAVVAAVLVRVEAVASRAEALARLTALEPRFVRESIAASFVADGLALAATDFRVHEDGMSRIAVLAQPEMGPRRLGRTVQRLLEIETYKSMSMLTLPIARETLARLSRIDRDLSDVIGRIAEEGEAERETLDELTRRSAEIERASAAAAFRFGAARAYEAIVLDRIAALREERAPARQTFSEFMLRRYDPAMRTCKAAEARLAELSGRAARIADLLRTRVDVAMSAQNQKLLASMDRRAALQLTLQRTVEGLSAVAISYYAVGLGAYLLHPLAQATGVSKGMLTAALVPPVLLAAWLFTRRIHRLLERHGGGPEASEK